MKVGAYWSWEGYLRNDIVLLIGSRNRDMNKNSKSHSKKYLQSQAFLLKIFISLSLCYLVLLWNSMQACKVTALKSFAFAI